ncbi:MAG: sigma-70 family RNA polymerase sigma factor [Planctomycetes bacterium]|nr:sigma-70 family RNA polymerase sigma factor [Planctomycetota bacterium]
MTHDATPADDSDLVARAIAGEPLALERLLIQYQRQLLSVIAAKIPETMATVVSAEDILQETYTEAFRGIGAFRPDGENALFRWLCTIADHRALDAVRAHRAAKRGGGRAAVEANAGNAASTVMALLDIVFVNDRTPSRSAAGHEAVAAVQSALESLKPEYRDAIRFRYIEGLSVGETADRMKKTDRSVHKLCSRAIQKLREELGDASKFYSKN